MTADEASIYSLSTTKEFGSHLRALRGDLTQSALARRSGRGRYALTRQRVSNIENGLLPTSGQLECYLQGCARFEQFEELEVVRDRLGTLACLPPVEPGPESSSDSRLGKGRLRRVVACAVSAVAAAGLVMVLTAEDAKPGCAENFICFWSESDFAGQKLQEPPDWVTGSHCIRLTFTVRSEINNTKERQRGYANSDCSDLGTVLQNRGAVERSVNFNAYKHT